MSKGIDDTGFRAATSKDLNASSQIVTALLVEWGGDDPDRNIFANKVGYVNGNVTQNVFRADLGMFTALPTLEIDLKKQHGGIDDSPVEVRMSINTPFDIPAAGIVSQPLWASVYEWDPTNPDTTLSILYRGRVARMTVNPNGLADVIDFKIEGNKAGLKEVLVGIPALTTCPWTLGDKTCKVNLAPLREVQTIGNIVGKTVTLNALTTQTSRYWERGYVRYEKQRIGIRVYDGGLTLETYIALPVSLIGSDIELTPGCDKTITTCRARFDNEELFGGFGYAIPAYTPIFEGG